MKKNRMKILAHGLLVLGLSVSALSTANAQTKASVTKVGNGDDGADLEDLSPLTSGPIVEARKRALKLLDKLNVVGVPGLGMLTPELEKTDLLIAAKDVHPTGEQKGSLEISEDQSFVYARTFATPSAATRFFPAAKKLNSDQLVALHIHEALHRALPTSIRENENIVMHFTLAITSPGANFDRVHQVSNMYLKPNGQVADSNKSKSVEVSLPEASKTTVKYRYDSYSYEQSGLGGSPYTVHGLEFNTSLGGYNSFMGRAVEPAFRARLNLAHGYEEKKKMSPLSLELEARVATETGVTGPFLRITTPLEDDKNSWMAIDERDVTTLGGFYRAQYDSSYFNGTAGYTLPSRGRVAFMNDSVLYKSILSLNTQFGFKWKGAQFGALAEFHASKGKDIASNYPGETDSFNLVIVGPEISYSVQNFELRTYFKKIVNGTQYTMDDMADIMDHGYGIGAFGASLSYGW